MENKIKQESEEFKDKDGNPLQRGFYHTNLGPVYVENPKLRRIEKPLYRGMGASEEYIPDEEYFTALTREWDNSDYEKKFINPLPPGTPFLEGLRSLSRVTFFGLETTREFRPMDESEIEKKIKTVRIEREKLERIIKFVEERK